MADVDTSMIYAALAGAALSYALLNFFILPMFSTQEKFLNQAPWVGVKKRFLARFWAGVDAVSHTAAMMEEGYEKYSKNNKVFVLPQFSREPFVVIPADKAYEFLAISDERVDHETIGREGVAHEWSMGDNFPDQSHFQVVRRQLTRKLPMLTNDVYGELVMAMKRNWPAKKDEWTSVNVYPTVMRIVSQAANRVFSGKELCRDLEFLDNSRMYAQEVFKSGALLKLCPRFLKPLGVGRYLTRGIRKHMAVCRRIAFPVIKERLRKMQTEGKDYVPETDVLQWVIDDALANPDTRRHQPEWILHCLLLLNMVAIHTTSMVTTNTILDLYSSPHCDDYVAGMRDEAERVLAESKGEWTKEAVNDMLRIDSVIRETMRISSLGELGLPRIIKDPNGVTLSGGIHLPYGVRVVIPTHALQTDSANYGPNAKEWDGFRFSRPREEFNESSEAKVKGDSNRLDKVLELKNQSLIVTNDQFFTFGAQRHACPGRFFASQEIKLMMAYVVQNYDIKIEGGRPKNFAMNGANVPTDSAQMQIRLRQS